MNMKMGLGARMERFNGPARDPFCHGVSMTIREAAKTIGISASKLYQLVSQRRIGHYRVGGKVIIAEQDIETFLASCRVAAAPQVSVTVTPKLRLKHLSLS